MSRVAEHSQDFNLFEVLFCFVFFGGGKKNTYFFFPRQKKKKFCVIYKRMGRFCCLVLTRKAQ